jgi:hypothetical protein
MAGKLKIIKQEEYYTQKSYDFNNKYVARATESWETGISLSVRYLKINAIKETAIF